MIAEALKKEYIPKYSDGEPKFYRYLLFSALHKLMLINRGEYKGVPPELGYLECYEQFIILYRREGDPSYLQMAKLFRRAAHRIYRIMLKKKMTSYNPKFLNLV